MFLRLNYIFKSHLVNLANQNNCVCNNYYTRTKFQYPYIQARFGPTYKDDWPTITITHNQSEDTNNYHIRFQLMSLHFNPSIIRKKSQLQCLWYISYGNS